MAAGSPVSESFLVWHRTREYDNVKECVHDRGGRHQQRYTNTPVVACRYWYELADGFWGQLTITNLLHLQASDLLPLEFQRLDSTLPSCAS